MMRHEPPRKAVTNTATKAGLCFIALTSLSSAAEDTALFESRIRPLLIENCIQCHGAEKQKGGLRLDSREGWQRGGDTGPAITPGNVSASLLSKAISYTNRDLKMPPKKMLTEAQIADMNRWIGMGAPDPRDAPAASGSKQKALTIAEGRNFWAYQLPRDHALPEVKNTAWPLNEIDHFILAKLEEKSLSPSPDADPVTLRRRIAFDLAGLPPDVSQAFQPVNAAEIDTLLASPRFAERMASHWMDLVRFAESSGGGRTLPFKDAWRYRDYVIESFHQDMPLTQFLTEQIAGDLLQHESAAERRRHLTATGFLTLGPTNYEEQDKQMLRMDIVDEQLDTIGRSFLGQTIGCARCHDHKFDPIPTRDCYALAGISPASYAAPARSRTTRTMSPTGSSNLSRSTARRRWRCRRMKGSSGSSRPASPGPKTCSVQTQAPSPHRRMPSPSVRCPASSWMMRTP
jgi:mono/diheme cytochrome c family protein